MKWFSWRLITLALVLPAALGVCQDSNPPIYSEIIPTSSGLTYNPATDIRESFGAPNGKTVEVLVKGPIGSGTYTRAIRPGETPDEYFPAVVEEAVKTNPHTALSLCLAIDGLESTVAEREDLKLITLKISHHAE